jgi:hypothetical protein
MAARAMCQPMPTGLNVDQYGCLYISILVILTNNYVENITFSKTTFNALKKMVVSTEKILKNLIILLISI